MYSRRWKDDVLSNFYRVNLHGKKGLYEDLGVDEEQY